jgi:hypothetical protein
VKEGGGGGTILLVLFRKKIPTKILRIEAVKN